MTTPNQASSKLFQLRKRLLPVLLLLAACLLFLPAARADASSGSITYLKGYNVWLADADGGNAHQVTTGGTYESPWYSPSQADDGTIVASFNQDIVRMKQNGQVINRINPLPLTNSVSHPMDGVPVEVKISPNGKLIAYSFVSYGCPIAAECGVRSATAYTSAEKLTPPGQYGTTYFKGVSWVGNSRTIQSGGYGSQIEFHNLDRQDPVHWFDDGDIGEPSTDLGDAELSPDGKHLAAIRGYGSSTQVIWYQVNGNAISGPPPAAPDPKCATNEFEGLAGPTWSPDSQDLVWEEPDGIWIKKGADSCDDPQPQMLIPGGSEPDWGPAANKPGPITTEPPPDNEDHAFKVSAVKTKLKPALKKGLKLKVMAPAAGRVKVKVRRGKKVVAAGKATASRAGKITVKAKFTRKARKALSKVKKVKLTATVTVAGQTGKVKITLRR